MYFCLDQTEEGQKVEVNLFEFRKKEGIDQNISWEDPDDTGGHPAGDSVKVIYFIYLLFPLDL